MNEERNSFSDTYCPKHMHFFDLQSWKIKTDL